MAKRDIVVIGGSAGAVTAVTEILQDLPPDFPATVFVALHLAPTSELDDGTSGLQAVKACGGMSVVQNPEDSSLSCPQCSEPLWRGGTDGAQFRCLA